jgi:hypothetical protein
LLLVSGTLKTALITAYLLEKVAFVWGTCWSSPQSSVLRRLFL